MLLTTPRPRAKARARMRAFLMLRDGPLCHYCQCLLREPDGAFLRPTTATIEHIVPRCLGGTNAPHNLVLACNTCNHDLGDTLDKCKCDFCQSAVVIHNNERSE